MACLCQVGAHVHDQVHDPESHDQLPTGDHLPKTWPCLPWDQVSEATLLEQALYAREALVAVRVEV